MVGSRSTMAFPGRAFGSDAAPRRVLVLGATGMLGHQLCRELAGKHHLFATSRSSSGSVLGRRALDGGYIIEGVDAGDATRLEAVVRETQPEWVINCIGIVKQKTEAKSPISSIEVNALLPHRLAKHCSEVGARLLHLSTDCVFSGSQGPYAEDALPDPVDLYGRTKLLGEVPAPHLTLRTSMIGLELGTHAGLVEWFLSQQGNQVRGFKNALYTGLTTAALSRVIERLIARSTAIQGIWHVASDPIDKYSLLRRLKELARLNVEIIPDEDFRCDRRLSAERFWKMLGKTPPSWGEMLTELAREISQREGLK